MEWIGDHLAVLMFLVLTFIMFVGYPVAFVLGASRWLRRPRHRVRGLPAGPVRQPDAAHLRSGGAEPGADRGADVRLHGNDAGEIGVAEELLKALQVLTRRIPGGLAMSVTLMGTIMAATTGIVGASVIMLTLIALPTMLAPATPRSFRSAPSPRPERSAS